LETEVDATAMDVSQKDATTVAEESLTRAACIQRWSAWTSLTLENLPLPFPWLVAVLGLAALGEQVLEYWLEDPTFATVASLGVAGTFVMPLLIVYILTYLRLLRRATVRALASLRSSVLIDDEEYEARAHHIVCTKPRTEWILLACAVSLVVVLFVFLKADLLRSDWGLPSNIPAAMFILGMYSLLGWLLLMLVHTSIRHGLDLYRLARRPLKVNVFDPTNLLPLGRLSMIQSLPIVGVLLIPMVLLGMPTSGGFLVVAVSAVSLLALFIPLWGVHEQIDQAKEEALDIIYRQLDRVQEQVLVDLDAEIPNFETLSDRTGLMLKLRETIQESSNWPFKDTAAVARAVVAVTSPLVYFVLNELIRTYLFPVLGSGGTP
jgi:hypothetical protein